jgi:hypothetical protein
MARNYQQRQHNLTFDPLMKLLDQQFQLLPDQRGSNFNSKAFHLAAGGVYLAHELFIFKSSFFI